MFQLPHKFYPFTLVFLMLFSCKEEKEKPSAVEVAKSKLDTLVIDKTSSTLTIERFKTLSDVQQKMRLGKIKFDLNIDKLSYHFKSTYTIDSGSIIYNEKYFEVNCYLSTKQLNVPVIDETNKVKFDQPPYLLNQDQPYIHLTLKGNTFPKYEPNALATYLSLKDSMGIAETRNSSFDQKTKKLDAEIYLNGKEWKLFNDSHKRTIVKDSILGELHLGFKQ